LSVPGYITAEQSKTGVEKVGIDFQSEFNELSVRIPFNVIDDARMEADTIAADKGITLFTDSIYTMPDSLNIPEVIPDSVLNSP
ncbi:MAG: hypothetical protein R3182_03325, partial [Draconibacterium sp.]|nr:hypothetical protein [Draconibacterium sp.]